ncbi:efflux RND transporter periplasmic adaptor subunit [Tahibacter amnicola]|uniref:Efflux RND transporter periplasmic adaptor subunit n=1 Tax=Tahibacter amnicola TaxID=2976241 RepID=A0ABY6B862_9GAMM|nr:efflux RND transporter periplasmic adaptor subunit [Tahibacter amnicola]UXI66276.1 efflux RND transporter periplasmic adaptor subunit [Tahibacter amnicola]
MDRPIEVSPARRWRRIAMVVGGVFAALLLVREIRSRSLPGVQKDSISVAQVRQANFEDAVNLRGAIMPETSVVLGASEGGRVEKIHIKEGTAVKKGDLLLEISNTSLQLAVVRGQADLAEQTNLLLGNQISSEQRRLELGRELLAAQTQLDKHRRQLKRLTELRKTGAVSVETLEDAQRNVEQQEQLKKLVEHSLAENLALRSRQERELQSTVSMLHKNIDIAQQVLDRLAVRSPIDGRLTSLKAEVGSTLREGDVIGQIDDESQLKVQANVDEFYIPRLQVAQHATVLYGGKSFPLAVKRIYPQVTNGQFRIDLDFVGEKPADLRMGQSLSLQLQLSNGASALQVASGPYVAQTGGRYVYVYDESRGTAQRRDLKLGRQSESAIEVLSGLKAGEYVITSSYETFGEAAEIRVLN